MRLQGISRSWIIALAAVVIGLMVACTCIPPGPVAQGKPTVVITSPADGSQFTVGQAITVQAVATDSQGVTRVTLSADGGLVDTNNNPSPQPTFNATLTWVSNTAGTHVLTVQAYNAGGTASDPALVLVNVTSGQAPGTVPTISSFVASPPSITAGNSSTLNWSVTGATSVEIDHGIGTVGLSGSRSVSPASTTTYLLTAHGTGGDATATTVVTVNPVGPGTPPVINSFVANPPTITAGGSSTLSWTVTGATSVEIDHSIGSVALSGSRTVNPASTTTYLLTAHGAGGNATATAVVTVNPAPVVINATVTYAGYDSTTGWVIFRVENASGSAKLECVNATVVNRSTSATYYNGYSDTPFHPDALSTTLEDNLPAGAVKFLRYHLTGNPTGVPCRATITLYTGNGQTGTSATKTVDFDLPAPAAINATVTYAGYDSTTGWVIFRVENASGSIKLECVEAHVVNRSTSANYYGPAYSDTPFHPSALSDTLEESLDPGATKFLRYHLTGNPTGVPCRATITLYTANGKTGTSAVKTVDFDLPGAAGINATITYHSYNASTGWVTFQVVNAAGGVALESATTRIINRSTSAVYYGGATGYSSNTPFSTSSATNTMADNVPPGATRYMLYKLTGNPTGVPCRATITLYSQDNSGGSSSTKTVDFDLPGGGASINATVTYAGYDSTTGWVIFRVENAPGSVQLECVNATIVNRSTSAGYYNGYSDTPFHPDALSTTLQDNLPAGAVKFLRYHLTGNPTGVPCRATITLYTGNGKTGLSAVKTVDFNL